MIAHSLEALLDWFIDGFERDEAELTEHGTFWKTDRILEFPPDMHPLGTAAADEPLLWNGDLGW